MNIYRDTHCTQGVIAISKAAQAPSVMEHKLLKGMDRRNRHLLHLLVNGSSL